LPKQAVVQKLVDATETNIIHYKNEFGTIRDDLEK